KKPNSRHAFSISRAVAAALARFSRKTPTSMIGRASVIHTSRFAYASRLPLAEIVLVSIDLRISPAPIMTHAPQQNDATATAGNCELIERLLPTGDVVRRVTVFIAVHWENNLPVPRSPPQRSTASVCHLNDLH